MVNNKTMTTINPVSPNVNPKQETYVFVPLASNENPGIASFYNGHFVVIDGVVKLNASYSKDLQSFPLLSEGYALGTQDGIPVMEGPYFQNNSKYYFEQSKINSENASISAENAKASEEKAFEALESIKDLSEFANNVVFKNPSKADVQEINSPVSIGGDLQVDGNLTVLGDTIIETTKSLQVEDNIIVTNYSSNSSRYTGIAMAKNVTDSDINTASALLFDHTYGAYVIGNGYINKSSNQFEFEFDDDSCSYLVSSKTLPDSYSNGTVAVWIDGKLSSGGILSGAYVPKIENTGSIKFYAEDANGTSLYDAFTAFVTPTSLERYITDEVLNGPILNLSTDLSILIGEDEDKSVRDIASSEVSKLFEEITDENLDSIREIVARIQEFSTELEDYVKIPEDMTLNYDIPRLYGVSARSKDTTLFDVRCAIDDSSLALPSVVIRASADSRYHAGTFEVSHPIMDSDSEGYSAKHPITVKTAVDYFATKESVVELNDKVDDYLQTQIEATLPMLGITATAEEINSLTGYDTNRGLLEGTVRSIQNAIYNGGDAILYTLSSDRQSYYVDSATSTSQLYNDLTSIRVANTVLGIPVTDLDTDCFSSMPSLKTVILPSNMVCVDERAFKDCINLETIHLGGTSILRTDVFKGCDNLKNVYVPSVEKWIQLLQDNITQAKIYSNPLYYGDYLYVNKQLITDLILPEIEVIPPYAFSCHNIEDVTIVEGIEGVGVGAFKDAINLKTVTINATGLELQDQAFEGCTSLTSIAGDIVVRSEVFKNCTSLSEVSLPLSRGDSIGRQAFYNCTSLSTINLPSTLLNISSYAFYNCSSLTDITLPEGLLSINYKAFCGCNLTTVILPQSLQYLGSQAFGREKLEGETTGMENVLVAASNDTFYTLRINNPANTPENNPDNLPESMLNGYNELVKVWITHGGTVGHIFQNQNIQFARIEGFGSSSANRWPIAEYSFTNCKYLKTVEIGQGINVIGEGAFKNCYELSGELSLPTTLTEMHVEAFANCTSLESVKFVGTPISRIQLKTFKGCSKLKSINLDSNCTEIASEAFMGCGFETLNLSQYTINSSAFANCTQLTYVYFDDNVHSIGSEAFSGCTKLTSVRISKSVSSIYNNAFPDSVTEVYYTGTEEEWSEIYMGTGNFANAIIYYNQT